MNSKLVNSVREMRDVQGMNGSWNMDPYMHGLYNGIEFALALMEQRDPEFRSAPEKWLADNGVRRSFPDAVAD